MSTTTALQPEPGPIGAPEAAPVTASRRRGRRILTWVLIVLFAILTPLTLVSGWAVKTVTNTDRYVATLQPLVEDPVVTNYVADRATTLLFEQLNVQQKVANLLPGVGSALAAPLTAQLYGYTQTEMRKVMSSQWFKDFWKQENTFTHATAVALLTGKNPPPVGRARSLAIGLSPVIIQAIDKLDARGVTVFNPIKRQLQTNKLLTLNLYSNKQLKTVQKIFNLAVELRVVLLIGTPLLGIAAILVAIERRRAAIRLLLGGILGILVLLGALTWLRSQFVGAAPPNGELFAQHVWDAMIHFLRRTVDWTLAIFTIAVLGLWVAGDSTWAVALRRTVRGGSRKIAVTAGEAYHSETTSKAITKATASLEKADGFVRKNLVAIRWLGVIVAAIFLFSASTTGGLWWIFILLALYQVLISVPWVRKHPAVSGGADEAEAPALVTSGAPETDDSADAAASPATDGD